MEVRSFNKVIERNKKENLWFSCYKDWYVFGDTACIMTNIGEVWSDIFLLVDESLRGLAKQIRKFYFDLRMPSWREGLPFPETLSEEEIKQRYKNDYYYKGNRLVLLKETELWRGGFAINMEGQAQKLSFNLLCQPFFEIKKDSFPLYRDKKGVRIGKYGRLFISRCSFAIFDHDVLCFISKTKKKIKKFIEEHDVSTFNLWRESGIFY